MNMVPKALEVSIDMVNGSISPFENFNVSPKICFCSVFIDILESDDLFEGISVECSLVRIEFSEHSRQRRCKVT